MHTISPFLWFDTQAEDAANLYVSTFKNSKITGITRYSEEGQEIHGQRPDSVMTISFELDGQPFTALNGGPAFKFNESVSFQVVCETQEEIDTYWEKLSAVPESEQCGWLKDRYGLSWQITPRILSEYLSDSNKDKVDAVMKVMLQMKKIVIADLAHAYNEH